MKIPSDCPLIDPAIIDETIGFFRANADRYDLRQQPASRDLARRQRRRGDPPRCAADHRARGPRPFEREHTTPFIWDQPERFELGNVAWSTGQELSSTVRLTLDYEEDYRLISAVFEALHRADSVDAAGALVPPFTVEAIVAYLRPRPEVRGAQRRLRWRLLDAEPRGELRTLGGHATRPAAADAALEAP